MSTHDIAVELKTATTSENALDKYLALYRMAKLVKHELADTLESANKEFQLHVQEKHLEYGEKFEYADGVKLQRTPRPHNTDWSKEIRQLEIELEELKEEVKTKKAKFEKFHPEKVEYTNIDISSGATFKVFIAK